MYLNRQIDLGSDFNHIARGLHSKEVLLMRLKVSYFWASCVQLNEASWEEEVIDISKMPMGRFQSHSALKIHW